MSDIQKITSRDNRRLVAARRVKDGRDAQLMSIEGRRLVEEALRSDVKMIEGFVTPDLAKTELWAKVSARCSSVAVVPDNLLRSITDTEHPQGIVIIAGRPETGVHVIEKRLSGRVLPTVVYLHEINNPSNLGAVLRTAEAAGAAGVIVSDNSADVFAPKSLRSSMGASFRLGVWDNVRFAESIEWAKKMGLRTTATIASADVSYTAIDWRQPRLLIFGSEAHGLGIEQLTDVDEKIMIPMAKGVDSLNLAVSAGVFLFEAKRQWDNT